MMPRRGQQTRTARQGPPVGLERPSGRAVPRADPTTCCVCGRAPTLVVVRRCGFCRAHRGVAVALARALH